ncbi:MAG TPA: alpha-1,4-glucan--maltose-1-phosphate maltosyltransferase [Candidatus Dormibacteraeota bacterium]|nr:alpha-1,4-glucan--maltose-1-phosphate maltosyltransferase [Candidatus Dormibacteraeota bacterium]
MNSSKPTGRLPTSFRLPATLRRVVIEGMEPEIDGGRFPIRRTVGELVVVQADIFADGHDVIDAVLLYRAAEESAWQEEPMHALANDRWEGQFRVTKLGYFVYSVRGWVDKYKTWSRDLLKKTNAGQDVALELLMGAEFLDAAAKAAQGADARKLSDLAAGLRKFSAKDGRAAVELAANEELVSLMYAYRNRASDTVYEKELAVEVDREQARFSSWYEMFPRSCAGDTQRHGTLRDCLTRLDYVAGMGFDVLYLPPIHPIGRTERKGKNNSVVPTATDPGSPWAIGSEEGGHKAIHSQLGNFDDLRVLREKANERGIELALDIAFQCSPDHPYVKEHREWFHTRPDGSVQYAENPPKKYQDIYPLDFESADVTGLAEELKSVVAHWIKQGIRIFRVDNPHTKPFDFWEWLINDIKREYPDVIFLSEAFTRPKVMYRLAKLGFTQSYTYFAWKNTKKELMEYFTEITQPPIREFFRANLWPNTPDILNEYLQRGKRAAFMARLILAATLGANYGIYGPAYELGENRPVKEGSEEYLNSEKYEIRAWDIKKENSLRDLITRVNGIRRSSPALQSDWGLRFHFTDNEQVIAYSKTSDDRSDKILVVVNLDPFNKQSAWVEVQLKEFRLDAQEFYEVHDLLTDAKYAWRGSRNYVELNPLVLPAHIFRVQPIN